MSKRERPTTCITVTLKNEHGKTLQISMRDEGGEALGVLWIDEIPYHVFFALPNDIGFGGEKFIVDRDTNYRPRPNAKGCCVLIAPYSD